MTATAMRYIRLSVKVPQPSQRVDDIIILYKQNSSQGQERDDSLPYPSKNAPDNPRETPRSNVLKKKSPQIQARFTALFYKTTDTVATVCAVCDTSASRMRVTVRGEVRSRLFSSFAQCSCPSQLPHFSSWAPTGRRADLATKIAKAFPPTFPLHKGQLWVGPSWPKTPGFRVSTSGGEEGGEEGEGGDGIHSPASSFRTFHYPRRSASQMVIT